MDIQHTSGESKGKFFINQDGEEIAEITYSKVENRGIIIDHTEVSESKRGKGIGSDLVKHAVDYAREQNLSVKPVCPFARSVIEQNKSLQDVL